MAVFDHVGRDLIRSFLRTHFFRTCRETGGIPRSITASVRRSAVFILSVRILGSTFVVPPLEEVFWRSFLYRYFVQHGFSIMPLNRFHPTSFIVTSVIFGLEHHEWLQGILCGLAFQWLVISKNRLGDAITAHAITNFLLGLWVVARGAWHFW